MVSQEKPRSRNFKAKSSASFKSKDEMLRTFKNSSTHEQSGSLQQWAQRVQPRHPDMYLKELLNIFGPKHVSCSLLRVRNCSPGCPLEQLGYGV